MVGNHLFDADIPYASAWISAWAFFLLAVARGVMNKPGTSTAYIQSSLAGLVGAYSGHLIFALFATYIIRNPFWVSGGLPKISEHIFISGSFVALASAQLVPLGYWIGHKRIPLTVQNSRWVYNGALIFTVIFWALARLAG